MMPASASRSVQTAKNLLSYPLVGNDVEEAGLYENSVAFIDRFAEEVAARGLNLRDRLDAQSLIW